MIIVRHLQTWAMALLNHLLTFIIALLYCAKLSLALYEDQAGLFDWHQQYVGAVKHVEFDQCGQSVCKRIIVSTDQHVIASLSMRTGEIAWRQIQEKSETGEIDDMLLLDTNLLVSMGGGRSLRCFSAAMGSLNWEFTTEVSIAPEKSILRYAETDDSKLILMLSGGTVHGLDVAGRLRWKQELPSSDTVTYSFMQTLEDVIHVVGVADKSHVTIVTLDARGTLLPKHTVSAAWVQHTTNCQFAGDQFVCIDVLNGIIHQLNLQAPDSFKSSLLQDLGLSCGNPKLLSDIGYSFQGEIAVLCATNAVMLRASDDGIKLVKNLPGVTALQIIKYGDHQAFITLARSKPEACEMRGYELSTGLELPELLQTVPIAAHHGQPLKLYGLVKKKDINPVFRVMTLSQDNSIILFQQSGKLTWVREEALSQIISVDMVDLPVSPILAKMEDEFGTETNDILGMFGRRLQTQISQIQTLLFQLRNRFKSHRHTHYGDHEESEYGEEDDDDSDDYLFRDDFNLKKIAILATEVGKVYGMYSSTGRILWRHLLTDVVPFVAAGKKVFPISMQRTTSHFPHDPHCTILGKHRESGRGVMYEFHPVSGAPQEDMPPNGHILSYKVRQMMMLSQMDEQFLRPIVILDTDLKYHIYPKSSTGMVKSMAPSLFMMTSDPVTAELHGYSMVHHEEKGFVAEEVWNLNLGADPQTITNIMYKRSAEHVHSQGIVLADRSVLYKYLNPNLVVITAESVDSSDKGFFNVYLIDSVSGQLVFHCNHKRVKGPVHVVHSENWIVYDYWNQRHRRTEIAVLELYEGKKQSNATTFSSLYPPPLPMVLRQSYIFPAHISSMGVTITEKGITNKHVLMALESGGILEMQKALLDPRRPEVPTQQHREEGIIPYMPELPRPNELIINYNMSVYNIRGIHTAPAGLESHSMILCYGLDMFYTRVMPSKMFDVLKEDFDYLFIGSVTFGMILISLITKKLASRKALNRAWK